MSIRTGPEEEYKRFEERRRSLEEKTRSFEEKARAEKLAIDKKLLVQILEEENLTHEAAVKELEDKIASFDQQLKPSLSTESAPNEPLSEPVEETPNADDGISAGLLQQPEQTEFEAPQEGSKKRKRSLF